MTLRIEIDKIAGQITFRSFCNDKLVETYEASQAELLTTNEPILFVLRPFFEKTAKATGAPLEIMLEEMKRAVACMENPSLL